MSNQNNAIETASTFLPTDIDGFESLAELALDLNWGSNHDAEELWRDIDPDLWRLTHNPWVMLQSVARTQLEKVLGDSGFRGRVDGLLHAKRQESENPSWFQQKHPNAALTCAAYFSMEYMLGEALPIYSGGLGNVAGDQLKAASDLGVPVVGVGLLYQQGYFMQVIAKDGSQVALYPFNDPGQLPITPLRDPNGEWLRLSVELPGCSVSLRAWQAQVGRVKLFLLDSNDVSNYPAHRAITTELYGGDPELRLKQEIVLGIGGWKLLRTLGIQPEVCHLNEGHAAFAILERVRSFMEETGQSFDVALQATRAGNIFTTHTAVPAGFDRFPPALVERYLTDYAKELGISIDALLALGRENGGDASEPFNMAFLAVRGSGAVNGVSELHGRVSRHIFSSLFDRWPTPEVPIGHVTNGVHVPTWDSKAAHALWTERCGDHPWTGLSESLEQDIRQLSDAELWELRNTGREALVNYARTRLPTDLEMVGAGPEMVDVAKSLFDPNALTIGFARRFASYKRPNLLLHDKARLLRLLSKPERPVQLIIAGKAHPSDEGGQAFIKDWIQFIRTPEARPHIIFVSDYDMLVSKHLVRGVDLWLNTPRRPWEASGTSGMKVLVNGGLNLSELDGWWAEAYTPDVGWAIGDGKEHGDDPAWDAAEAERVYELIEGEVAGEFYTRDGNGLPTAWLKRIRESMATLTPRFSADRTVREYTEQHYLPAAAAYLSRSRDKGANAVKLVEWKRNLEEKWQGISFGELTMSGGDSGERFEVGVGLGDLDPAAVKVELYADGVAGAPAVIQEMTLQDDKYVAEVAPGRDAKDYTARVVPNLEGVSIPLEEGHIAWQH